MPLTLGHRQRQPSSDFADEPGIAAGHDCASYEDHAIADGARSWYRRRASLTRTRCVAMSDNNCAAREHRTVWCSARNYPVTATGKVPHRTVADDVRNSTV